MGTNSALIESLECYMEDMIQCFEEFVKKTLFVVTVVAGALIAMVMYFLKNVNCRRRCITGAETQMEDIFGSHLRQGYSTSSVRTDRVISPSYTKTCSDFSMTGQNKCGKTVEITPSQNVLVDTPIYPKKSISCCSGKLPSYLKLSNCPGSSSRVCVKKNPCRPPPCTPPSCSRTSSCESLQSRSSCRESDSSICSKKPCASRSSCGTPLVCSIAPPPPSPCKRSCGPVPGCKNSCGLAPGCKRSCLPAPACNRSCSPAPCRHRTPCQRTCSPVSSCTRTCSPTPSCGRSCSKLAKLTVPSLLMCNTPRYKLELPACASIKPERCLSKPCFKPHLKGSCCSLCCDDK